jgi:hypothetical protein
VCRDVLEVFFLQRQKQATSYTIQKIQGEENAHVHHKVKAKREGASFLPWVHACIFVCVTSPKSRYGIPDTGIFFSDTGIIYRYFLSIRYIPVRIPVLKFS